MNLHTVIMNKLASMDDILFAYLFGSYAKNQQTQNSDLDIAIYLNTYSLDIELQINYELSKLLKKDVDIVILNHTRNLFLLESILRDGIILKDNPLRIDFELKKQHELLDYKSFRAYIDAA